MRRFVSVAARVGLVLAALPLYGAEAGSDVRGKLKDALLCKNDPLGTIRTLAANGSAGFREGFAGASFGDQMDETEVIILRDPLEIAGANTSWVILTLSSYYDEFRAIVYGRFSGDHKPVVSELGLVPAKVDDKYAIGKFVKSLPKIVPGEPPELCPDTIALTPLEKGGFLLGCGWCPG